MPPARRTNASAISSRDPGWPSPAVAHRLSCPPSRATTTGRPGLARRTRLAAAMACPARGRNSPARCPCRQGLRDRHQDRRRECRPVAAYPHGERRDRPARLRPCRRAFEHVADSWDRIAGGLTLPAHSGGQRCCCRALARNAAWPGAPANAAGPDQVPWWCQWIIPDSGELARSPPGGRRAGINIEDVDNRAVAGFCRSGVAAELWCRPDAAQLPVAALGGAACRSASTSLRDRCTAGANIMLIIDAWVICQHISSNPPHHLLRISGGPGLLPSTAAGSGIPAAWRRRWHLASFTDTGSMYRR